MIFSFCHALCDIKSKGTVTALMLSHCSAIHPHPAFIVYCAKVQNHPAL